MAEQSEEIAQMRLDYSLDQRVWDLLAEVERLRKALELACEDGWDDGQWAMRRYIEMAQASLSGSEVNDGI